MGVPARGHAEQPVARRQPLEGERQQHLVAALLELDTDFRRFTVAVLPLIGEKVRRLTGGDSAEDTPLAVIAGISGRRQVVLVGKTGVVDRYLDAAADDRLDL